MYNLGSAEVDNGQEVAIPLLQKVVKIDDLPSGRGPLSRSRTCRAAKYQEAAGEFQRATTLNGEMHSADGTSFRKLIDILGREPRRMRQCALKQATDLAKAAGVEDWRKLEAAIVAVSAEKVQL